MLGEPIFDDRRAVRIRRVNDVKKNLFEDFRIKRPVLDHLSL
jgi:hypothetical protein